MRQRQRDAIILTIYIKVLGIITFEAVDGGKIPLYARRQLRRKFLFY